MARARVPAPPATLMALLAVVAMAAADADNTTICDTVECGKGTCSVVPSLLPGSASYKCTCNPGWSQPLNVSLPDWLNLNWTPCMIPDCSFSSSCFDFTTTPLRGIPLLDPCVVTSCGQGGYCEKGANFSYQCRCQPGFKNLFSDTSMPCIDGSCTFGQDCARLGLNNPAAPAPAPVGNADLY